jgi:hypothetical protein
MYRFDVEQATKDCIQWIRDFFEENGKDCNAVVGISGGKDSSVVAALCVEALGKDRVIGVLMPKGEQFDACAQGRLLMLAPWEHHNERQRLTAMQCQQMNLMAIELAALPPKEAMRPAAGPPQPQRQKK